MYAGPGQLPLTSLVKEGVYAFAGIEGGESKDSDILRPVISVRSCCEC